jgi:hypothetical protein
MVFDPEVEEGRPGAGPHPIADPYWMICRSCCRSWLDVVIVFEFAE